MAFFAILGAACFISLASTLWSQPLFPFKMDSVEWLQSWLVMTVLDYYGAALPLAAVAVASEPGVTGWLWSAGFLLGGSPFCCAYVVLRLRSFGDDGLRFARF